MKVQINHVEKKTGMIRKTTHHGVSVRVTFDATETAIIKERKLERDVILERGYSSDVSDSNIEKAETRSLGRALFTAAVSGRDALTTHLTINKLMTGEDVFYLGTPMEAKAYEEELKGCLVKCKGWIVGNESVEQKSDTFEL
jgi:hypothetical protein